MNYISICTCPVCGKVFEVIKHREPILDTTAEILLCQPIRRMHAKLSPECPQQEIFKEGWKKQTFEMAIPIQDARAT